MVDEIGNLEGRRVASKISDVVIYVSVGIRGYVKFHSP